MLLKFSFDFYMGYLLLSFVWADLFSIESPKTFAKGPKHESHKIKTDGVGI